LSHNKNKTNFFIIHTIHTCGLGQHSWYSNLTGAGQSGNQILMEARFSAQLTRIV